MMRALVALAFALVLASPAVEATSPLPSITLTLTEDGWALDARATVEPGVANRLKNGDFSEGTSDWTLDTPEVGHVGNLTAPPLRIELPARHPGGSVWAYQRVEGAPHDPMDFQVSVRDDGHIAGYAIVLREETSNRSQDVVVEAPPSPTWRTLSARWTPDPWATALYVQLRVLAPADTALWVEFSDARLLPAARWSWALDGATLVADGPVAPLPRGLVGTHEARLDIRTYANETASTTWTFTAPPLLAGRLLGPSLVRTGASVGWSAADLRPAGGERLANGAFDAGTWGWRLDATEIGGNASASADSAGGFDGAAARIDLRAAKSGTAYLVQDVPLNAARSYDFSVLRRDTGVLKYGFLVRETGFSREVHPTPYPWFDTEWELPSAANWTPFAARWHPHFNDSTRALVFLRVYARPDDRVSVWFDDVSLAPERTFAWTLDGRPVGDAADLAIPAIAAGEHALAVNVDGIGNATREVLALDASAALAPTVGGSVRASWSVPSAIATIRISKGGTTRLVAASAGAWIDPAPSAAPARYRVDALAQDSSSVTLADGIVTSGEFAVIDAVVPPTPTRGDLVVLRAHVLDPDVAILTLDIEGARVPLARDANGTWSGVWRVPLWAAGDLSGKFTAATQGGAVGSTAAGTLSVTAFTNEEQPIVPIFVVLLAAAGGWLAPWIAGVNARRRGGSPPKGSP
ncbi:MAG: hypothetical protein ACYDCK_00970 [Thermoplasmatota archaeon]